MTSTDELPAADYTNDGIVFIALCTALGVIATALVALRFWARFLTRLPCGADDYLALAALLVHHLSLGFGIEAVAHAGLGRDVGLVMAENPLAIVLLMKLVLAVSITWGVAAPLIKLSVLVFYARVFPTRTVRAGCYVLGALSVGWMVAVNVTTGLQCVPIQRWWDPTLDGYCIDYLKFYLINGALNCVIDALTILLPIQEVLRLQTSFSKRVAVCAVFALGAIAFAASLVRAITIHILRQEGITNFTKQFTLTATAAVVEVYVAIIGACLPLLPPVYRKLKHGTVMSTRATASSSSGGGGPSSKGSVPLSSLKSKVVGGNAAAGLGSQSGAAEGDFYRLENGYECDPATPAHRKHRQTVGIAARQRQRQQRWDNNNNNSSEEEEGDDYDYDGRQLGGIVVKKEFIWNGPDVEPH